MGEKDFTSIARVTRAHGLKGEVRVSSDAPDLLRCLVGRDVWFVPPVASVRSSVVSSVRETSKGPLMTLSGVSAIDDARALIGREILVSTADLPAEWFDEKACVADYVGYVLTDSEHGVLGAVVETIVTGANDVWVVHGQYGELLIPVIADVVDVIDEDSKSVSVTLLPGLLREEALDS